MRASVLILEGCKEIQSPLHPWVLSTVCSEMSRLNPTPLLGFYQSLDSFYCMCVRVHVIFANCSQKTLHPSEKCMIKSAAIMSLEQSFTF